MAFNGWLIKRDPRIHSLGYVEHDEKRGLFKKQSSTGTAYLDHRIDTEFPYRGQYLAGPRFYFRASNPKWKSVRTSRFEEALLIEHGIKFDQTFTIFEANSDEQGIPEDGFCQFCNNDFQDEGMFCSEEFKRDNQNQIHNLCEACQEPLEGRAVTRHHISYYPEQVVSVHQSCHMEIHRSDKYLHLRPADNDTNRFYKKGKHTNENVPLPKYTGRLDDFSHFH
jgi:hypothetical protein